MGGESKLVDDPGVQRLLARRHRWRWTLSGLLIGAYFTWAIGGIYFSAAYAVPLPGTAIPRGIAVGLLIIIMSIILSIVYVRIVDRIEAGEISAKDSHR